MEEKNPENEMSNSTGNVNTGGKIISKYIGETKTSPFMSRQGQLQVKGRYPHIKYLIGIICHCLLEEGLDISIIY